jgi:hypothetical protein
MCSNERLQIVGVGDAARIDRLEVTWPSGLATVSENLPVNQTVFAVEGRPVVVTHPSAGEDRDL